MDEVRERKRMGAVEAADMLEWDVGTVLVSDLWDGPRRVTAINKETLTTGAVHGRSGSNTVKSVPLDTRAVEMPRIDRKREHRVVDGQLMVSTIVGVEQLVPASEIYGCTNEAAMSAFEEGGNNV